MNIHFFCKLAKVACTFGFSYKSFSQSDNEVYIIDADCLIIDKSVFKTFEAAVNVVRNKLDDDEGCIIIKRNTDESRYNEMRIYLNNKKEIYDIDFWDSNETGFDTEFSIQNAYAELPHLYKVGDILRYREEYAVIVNVGRYETLPDYKKHSDDTDMCLLCLGYYVDRAHSCGGSFCHDQKNSA